MAAGQWKRFPYAEKGFTYTDAALRRHWPRLHKGDCEPFPTVAGVRNAWRAYHAGDFEHAVAWGADAGGGGMHAAIKAACIYAIYLETSPIRRLALLRDAAQRARGERDREPGSANAWYLEAMALGRYAQHLSVAKALTEGIGARVHAALVRALELEPKHADAEVAMGTYHAEVIGKIGAVAGRLTYGVTRDAAVAHFERALDLNPASAIARIEYADALVLMYDETRREDAKRLYAEAAACEPRDAMERLDVARAQRALAEG